MSYPPPGVVVIDTTEVQLPRTVQSAIPAASSQMATGIGLITSVTCRETTGSAAASFHLHDGSDNSGPRMAAFGLPSGGSQPFGAGSPGIPFRAGIYLEVIAGSADITVTYIPYPYGFTGSGT